MDDATARVLAEVAAERAAQIAKFGQQDHPDGTGPDAWVLGQWTAQRAAYTARCATQRLARDGKVTWLDIALEEVFEAMAEDGVLRLRTELIQAAAVFVAWVEKLDRQQQAAATVCQTLHGAGSRTPHVHVPVTVSGVAMDTEVCTGDEVLVNTTQWERPGFHWCLVTGMAGRPLAPLALLLPRTRTAVWAGPGQVTAWRKADVGTGTLGSGEGREAER